MTGISIPVPPFCPRGRKIESLIRKALYDFGMLQNVEHMAIALSGGKDSLSLLFFLSALRGRGFANLNITAMHVSGKYSCGPSKVGDFLLQACDGVGVELLILPSERDFDLNCYSCSRERRRLLFNACRDRGIETIAFGHHLDDNAETVLMNMLQKGQFSPMNPKIRMIRYGITIIRPLIYVPEKMIRSFAERQGFLSLLCRCPIGQNSVRRRVKRIIEDMERDFPNCGSNIAKAGLLYGSDKATRIRSNHEHTRS